MRSDPRPAAGLVRVGSEDVADKRISVGVSFPARFGTVTAIWPCGLAVVGEAGLRVDVRPRVFRRFLWRFAKPQQPAQAPLWEAPWDSLAGVEVGPRSAVLRARTSRGCRVVFVGRPQLQLLLEELTEHDVDVRRVKTTFGWYFRGAA
jgi:hypothetical protein